MKLFKRFDGRWAIVVLLVVGTLGVAVAGYAAQDHQYSQLFALYQKQNRQLRDHGIEPSTPSHDRVAQSGPAGAQGERGPQGPGPTDAQVYIAVQDYCSTPQIPCKGAPGAAGQPGADGQSIVGPQGKPGADSTVPGPAGPTGKDGTPGQPPESWTYTDILGTQHTCTRADPFDPTTPTYQCT